MVQSPSSAEDKLWPELCKAHGTSRLVDDPRFRRRSGAPIARSWRAIFESVFVAPPGPNGASACAITRSPSACFGVLRDVPHDNQAVRHGGWSKRSPRHAAHDLAPIRLTFAPEPATPVGTGTWQAYTDER